MRRARLALLVLATAFLVVAALVPAAPAAAAEGVIVCSCRLCAQNPYVECQIGPGDGYSILCADYLKINC